MEFLLWLLLILLVIGLVFSRSRKARYRKEEENQSGELAMNKEAVTVSSPLVYQGEDLDFSEELIRKVLIKHFPFFNNLLHPDQDNDAGSFPGFRKIFQCSQPRIPENCALHRLSIFQPS